MTEEQSKLLAVFEVRIQDILALSNEQKAKIEALELKLDQEKTNKRQIQEELQALKAKYGNLLTAHVVTAEAGGDVKSARMKLLKLVREIDKCVALLNG
jgi:lipase chaperone LimK